jgi:hypothetical protein
MARLGFAHEAGVDNYSICLAGRQRGIYHYLPDEGRSQLFQLNNSLKGSYAKTESWRVVDHQRSECKFAHEQCIAHLM